MRFTVPGKVVGKERPRFVNGHSYTPKRTKEYESRVLEAFAMADNDLKFEEPVGAYIIIYVEMPKGWSQKKKREEIHKYPVGIQTPDLDNAAKAILDALNGLAYKDDKQVVSLEITRLWGSESRVDVELWNMEE